MQNAAIFVSLSLFFFQNSTLKLLQGVTSSKSEEAACLKYQQPTTLAEYESIISLPSCVGTTAMLLFLSALNTSSQPELHYTSLPLLQDLSFFAFLLTSLTFSSWP